MNTKRPGQFLIRFAYFAVILAIAIFICRYGIPALLPFVVAFVVSLLLRPLVRFLHEKCRIHKGIAAVVTVLLFYCLLGLVLVLLSVKLFTSAKAFVLNLPELYNTTIEPLLASLMTELDRFITRLDPSSTGMFSSLVSSLGTSLETSIVNFSGKALAMLGGYAVSVPGFLLNVLISVIATVFITMDYPVLKAFILHQLSDGNRRRAHEIRVHLGKTLGQYVRSYALILLITFFELMVGLLLIGVDNAVLIALLIAIFDILPVVGSGTVLLPWAIITALLGNYRLAIGLVLLYVVIVIVRNIIEPKIVGQHVGLHPIVTLLAMVVGTYVFGPIGLLGLPVALAIAVSMNDAGVIQLYRPTGGKGGAPAQAAPCPAKRDAPRPPEAEQAGEDAAPSDPAGTPD